MQKLPYGIRLLNRLLLAVIFFLLLVLLFRCVFSTDASTELRSVNTEEPSTYLPEKSEKKSLPSKLTKEPTSEKKLFAANDVSAKPNQEAPIVSKPEKERIDSSYILNQKNVFMAQKIDNLLRQFKPDYAAYLIVDPNTNEVIAWGARANEIIQNTPAMLARSSYPAASLIKTVTVAAALESRQYSLNTQIPLIGSSHTLYKRQIRPKKNHKGSTISLQDAYAKSSNPPMAIVGYNIGAAALRAAAKNLGFNQTFPQNTPLKSNFSPPDTGYALAETASGFTQATTLSPLLAAAQIRAILKSKPLEIPHADNASPYIPQKAYALSAKRFSENTYYGLREAMLRSITNGTARRNISTKYMARKNYKELQIGGKTGSLDGSDPKGRYEWFAGFARFKSDPSKAIVIVVMQAHKETRSQPATQVAAMLINYWAHSVRK